MHTEPPDPTDPTDRPAGPSVPEDRPAGPSVPEDRPAGPSVPEDRPAGPSDPHDRPAGPSDPDDRPAGPAVPEEPTGLSRSADDRMLFGVCGGIAERYGFEALLVRLVFLGTLFLGGAGVLFYLAAAVLVPAAPDGTSRPAPAEGTAVTRAGGVLRVLVGLAIAIAAFTAISPKTVEHHVSAVLRKLQLSNRHELTRWATERRLVE